MRIWRGLDNEPMPFDAPAIADVLVQLARENADAGSRFLEALADALDNSASEWKLTLTRTTRGVYVPPDVAERHFSEAFSLWAAVERAKRDGKPLKNAVSDMAHHWGISRAMAFQRLREGREFAASADSINVRAGTRPTLRDSTLASWDEAERVFRQAKAQKS